MDRVEVLALIMAMDGKLYSLDMIVAHLNSLALWVNVAMLVVVLRLSDGNDHAIVKVFSMLMRISGFRHFYYYNFSRLMRDGLVVSVVALVFKIVVVLAVLIVRVSTNASSATDGEKPVIPHHFPHNFNESTSEQTLLFYFIKIRE